MNPSPLSRRHAWRILIAACVLVAWAANARAQGAVGSGPITSTLTQTEPTTGVITLGRVKLAPGLTIREIGVDRNVFDEVENPKEDFVAAGTPDVAAFLRLRFAQLSGYLGSELQYYKKYESERSIGLATRGRVDFLMSRFRPFIGAGYTRSRTRPNGEIDVRANQIQDEVSGGLAFELSPHAVVFSSLIKTSVDYRDALQSNVSLDQTLSRSGTEYMGGVKTDLTPLTSLQVRGTVKKDEFRLDPMRNGESRNAAVVFAFSPPAVISGSATLGFQDYKFVDPLVNSYRGMTGSAFITFSLFELARINVGFNRAIEYSFDTAEAYFLENTYTLAYTHRLFGAVDLQARGSHALFDYGHREGAVAHTDTLQSVNGSVGYNLRNRTRVAANYEWARRRSPELELRNYDRRRLYLSWAFAY